VRRVLDRLRDKEWPIESVRGATGGYRLDRRRLSVAQRNWLEEEFPVDRT
jgi:DNA-binding IscR family transcriptional regulator